MYAMQNGVLVRASDGACIPVDAANSDYRAYQEWCSAGNSIPTPSEDDLLDAAIAQVEAAFSAKKAALSEIAVLATLRGGPQLEASIAALQQDYATAVVARQTALDALWGV